MKKSVKSGKNNPRKRENLKKILIVDDSALMRSVLGDIINSDSKFHVEDRAKDGAEALDLIKQKSYDAVVLDVNMPRMNGIQLLKEIQKNKIRVRVMMSSTDTKEGAKVTMDALELGAIDFIHKPDRVSDCRDENFSKKFLNILSAVCNSNIPTASKSFSIDEIKSDRKVVEIISKSVGKITGNKVVAIASSTGGPRALQAVIPKLPSNLNAPVVIVQHMPVGFTASLAERLNSLSQVKVHEAVEGEPLLAGNVYLARGSVHLKISSSGSRQTIHYEDGPTREGVKPCANFMFESLLNSSYDQVVCVVLTGMGADGTEGICNLKNGKNVHVITQDADSCVVYGMPKAVAKAGLADQVVPLDNVAQEILMNVGVK